jgi:hypothetical protein
MEKVNHLADFNNFKSLRNLAKWMKKTIASKESWTSINVTSFDHRPGTRTATTSFTNIQDLRKALCPNDPKAAPSGSSDAPVLRLFLVEDPSFPLVELFGSRFNVDPLFFGAHFKDKLSSEPPRLLATGLHRQWLQLRHVLVASYVNDTNTTLWIGQDRLSNDTTIGIVLLDRCTTRDRSAHDPDSCVPTPDLNNAFSSSLPPPTKSWFDHIVELTSRYPWFAPTRHTGAVEQLAIVCPAIYAACAEWLSACQLVESGLGDIEAGLRGTRGSARSATSIDDCLSNAEFFQNKIRSYLKMVGETLDQSLPAAARLTAGTRKTAQKDSTLENIIPDFKRVLQHLQELETRVDRLVDRCTGEMQLAAARESLAESHNLARLTWLATIFVPLTFVTGLFSMNADIGSLKDSFKIYFSAAVPVAIVALVTARWSAQILRRLRDWIFDLIKPFVERIKFQLPPIL